MPRGYGYENGYGPGRDSEWYGRFGGTAMAGLYMGRGAAFGPPGKPNHT